MTRFIIHGGLAEHIHRIKRGTLQCINTKNYPCTKQHPIIHLFVRKDNLQILSIKHSNTFYRKRHFSILKDSRMENYSPLSIHDKLNFFTFIFPFSEKLSTSKSSICHDGQKTSNIPYQMAANFHNSNGNPFQRHRANNPAHMTQQTHNYTYVRDQIKPACL